MPKKKPTTSEDAGVRIDDALPRLIRSLETVRGLGAPQRLGIGHFASVIEIGDNLGLAVTTDGVGTKILIAQMMDRYDTIGIDCVAMNVNDLLCVGATPVTMVDYLAVQEPHDRLLEEIGIGLAEGARRADINICGGELAQIRPMVNGVKADWGFDLVGTGIGLVALDAVVDGNSIENGDVVLGIASNGLHSNGYSLARKVLLEQLGLKIDSYVPELKGALGEELLKDTFIYVEEILELLNSDVPVKGLAHITSDGFGNLARLNTSMGFHINNFSKTNVHDIFHLIQERGSVEDEEMFRVYNMGIGFCVIVPPNSVSYATSILSKSGRNIIELGHVDRELDKPVIITEPFRLFWNKEIKRFEKY
ncbi:phosphoribosylformylglycinamidine cyclo-ligase [Nitrospinae bacterium AH_259_B05_G02_I21]|nr:phosphoribosylformylglycinamidine cyclo-ligase [Nitrospinae bacterium AH_259_B05_G02_I21]MDA2932292.1 phosphoribosylformylglycinamidine cyclo-ligase [Nitrospinae bacterium AH-259-F20]